MANIGRRHRNIGRWWRKRPHAMLQFGQSRAALPAIYINVKKNKANVKSTSTFSAFCFRVMLLPLPASRSQPKTKEGARVPPEETYPRRDPNFRSLSTKSAPWRLVIVPPGKHRFQTLFSTAAYACRLPKTPSFYTLQRVKSLGRNAAVRSGMGLRLPDGVNLIRNTNVYLPLDNEKVACNELVTISPRDGRMLARSVAVHSANPGGVSRKLYLRLASV